MDHQEPLIPLATRSFQPTEHTDSSEETIWENPTDGEVILDLQHEMPKARFVNDRPVPPKNWSERTGKRRYVIPARAQRALPGEYDIAIQHTRCTDAECPSKQFECKDPKHKRVIIGGLGPQLVNRGTQRRPMKPEERPTLEPALDDAEARRLAARQELAARLLAEHDAKAAQEVARGKLDEAEADISARKTSVDSADAASTKPHKPTK